MPQSLSPIHLLIHFISELWKPRAVSQVHTYGGRKSIEVKHLSFTTGSKGFWINISILWTPESVPFAPNSDALLPYSNARIQDQVPAEPCAKGTGVIKEKEWWNHPLAAVTAGGFQNRGTTEVYYWSIDLSAYVLFYFLSLTSHFNSQILLINKSIKRLF